ncbi:MAG: 2-oxo acid dehydrogenase subunit E2 [Oleiphilus sp.]|nr:MAG: 2-oxo acid dehydrogenase subunit E2 [Oleiphilus sp.]
MKYFKLPDLGEGLQEAEIVEWHVNVGDSVELDQLLVSVETAKAIVEVPSPQAGVIAELFGQEGDLIHIGEPLLEYANEEQEDSGTVVGKVKTEAERSDHSRPEVDQFIIGSPDRKTSTQALATPAIRALAKRLNVSLDGIKGSGRQGLITGDDVEKAARMEQDFGQSEPLKGVRRVMAKNMAKAHAEVVKVTIHDLADIHHWFGSDDPTLRLIKAMSSAIKAEPNLNAWYNGEQMSLRVIESIDLGIAVDTPDGLFVPVLRDIGQRTDANIRQGLDALRADVKTRTIPPKELMGATITLSNYGTIAGRFGNPVIVPPMVAILGAGKIHEAVVPHKGKPVIHAMLPLSLSFDHRAITGGEAARFLAQVIESLQQ